MLILFTSSPIPPPTYHLSSSIHYAEPLRKGATWNFQWKTERAGRTFLVPLNLTKVNCFLLGLHKTFFVLNYTSVSLITVHALLKSTNCDYTSEIT